MKKTLLAVLVSTVGLCSGAFGYLENNFFCSIIDDTIIVSLKAEDATDKCSEYLRILDTSLNREYKAFLLVQSYIDNKQSITYRRSVRDTKQAKINYLLTMKDKIIAAMSVFEGNVFTKVREYMIYISRPYVVKYKRMLRPIQLLGTGGYEQLNGATRNAITLLQTQLANIESVKNATGYDVLNSSRTQYLLLKKQIEGK